MTARQAKKFLTDRLKAFVPKPIRELVEEWANDLRNRHQVEHVSVDKIFRDDNGQWTVDARIVPKKACEYVTINVTVGRI